MTTPSALHSKKTPKWGTPKYVVDWGRELLDNKVDFDPASSEEFNTIVQATHIFTEQTNGLAHPWHGNIFLNPPGGLVNEFWRKLTDLLASGQVSKAFWVGFSVEQLCTLASERFHPLDFSTCVLRKRIAFNTEALVSGGAPSHGNYVTALGCDRTVFDRLFTDKGKVSHGLLAV